ENLLAVCAFKDWNPSHFLDTAEMSHAVGVGYDWVFDYLDAESREKIRAGLIKNGLEPGLGCYARKGSWWWTQSHHNWNQVCNGGLIVGALAIAETDPKYASGIIPKAVASLPLALGTYAPDGAWPEGPGYWGYATRYTVYGLAALDTALGKDFGLSKMKGLPEAGLFPIYACGPTKLYFNFADVGTNSRRRKIPSLFWLASRYDKPFLADAEREMLSQYSASPQDFIWYVPAGKKAPTPTLDKYFRGPVEVAVFRSAWNDPDALFVAVKAGYNQVNHGHLDLGSFEIDALGTRWARDLGKENYNLPGYWTGGKDAKRWTYYRLSSFAHNVPVLGGKNQDVFAKTKITKFKTTPTEAFSILDLTSAYKDFAKKVTRGVAIVGNRKAVLVQDEFDIKKPCEVAWGITTDAKIVVEKDRAILTRGRKKMTVQILSPAGAVFTVESAEQKPPLKSNKGVKRLMIRLKKQKGDVRITVIFSPQWPKGKQPISPAPLKPLSEW
ncbi:MAG: heparinase II/III family protein, partial [Phycisphaerae bacterium]|nr:heparinase II/III family protein [Phycisphaerae bacterium]